MDSKFLLRTTGLFRWVQGVALATLIFLGLTTPWVSGQADYVELQLKLGRGETLFYTTAVSADTLIQIGATRSTNTVQGDAREAIRVLDVDQAGNMLVEVVFEDSRQTSDGRRLEETIVAPWIIKVSPDGKVVERQTGGEHLEDFPIALPGHPIKVGDSWTRQARTEEAGATIQVKETSTLVAVDQVSDNRVAHIRTRLEVSVTGRDRVLLDRSPTFGSVAGFNISVPGFQSRASGTGGGSEDIDWLVERGRPLRRKMEQTIDVRLELSGQGETIRGMVTTKLIKRREALSPDRVAVPTVSADLLIVPGKAIAAFPLDLSISDLVNRLGSPSPSGAFPDSTMWGADRGFRSAEVSWPNGLVAYLDPADRTTLLGLGIADRRYRTGKGLGFGSSQGAIMMAYGMSPTRVEMLHRATGGVRVLIYNDQGIAFAITADKKHMEWSSGHAPVGAVDWIVIFPTGGAGRIFPVP